ncbi:MAG: hypothetical protein AAF916_12095, partial [Planctomycetota bacterium]
MRIAEVLAGRLGVVILGFGFSLAVSFAHPAAAVEVLQDERSVGFNRIDGVKVVSSSLFGGPVDAAEFDNTASASVINPFSPDEELTLTSRGSLFHRSYVEPNSEGGLDLYAMLGALASTGSGLQLPAATAGGSMDVTVRFDAPQRYDMVIDAVAGGDEARVLGSYLNGLIEIEQFGALFGGFVTGPGLQGPYFGNEWRSFFAPDRNDFAEGAGFVRFGGNSDEFTLIRFEGVLEPGEYVFEMDLEGPADGEDPFVSMAGFVDFTSRALLDLAGDVNRDEAVDQADLDAVLTNWGSAVDARAMGDVDGDGVVAQGDLDAVLTGWGSAAAPVGLERI